MTTKSMAEVGAPQIALTQPSTASAMQRIRCGWAASVWIVLVATAAAHAGPHVPGIGFVPALRLAVLVPTCIAMSVASTFVYDRLKARLARPRTVLATSLGAVALLALGILAATGDDGTAGSALPAVGVAAIATAWWVPRYVDRPSHSRAKFALLLFIGAVELAGVGLGLSSERAAPRGSDGMAFEIPQSMFDVDHKFVDLPSGSRVHYIDEGAGDTLLFLHGNPAWSFQWRGLVHALRGSHRCVALDYPGFGLSDGPAGFGYSPREQSQVVEEFVEQLGLRDVTLVMQDWGGPIGMGFAGRRPELVRGLVLGSTWAWPTTTDEPRGKFSFIAGGSVGEFIQINFNGFVTLGIENGIVHKLSPDVLEVYRRPFLPIERRGIAAYYPNQINAATAYFEEVEAGLPRLSDKPALIFWALDDQGFPRSDLMRFQAALPRNETIELPGVDHFFFEDVGDQMVEPIKRLVGRGAAPR